MDEFNANDDPYRIERPDTPAESGPRCFQCGYDLSGIDPSGVCPECGIPVEFSDGHGPLSAVESDALDTITRGFGNAMAGILLYVIVTIASIIASIAISATTIQQIQPGQQPTFSRLFYLVNFASNLLTTLASCIFLIGWWKITTPPEGLPEPLDRGDWRTILRITIPIQIVGLIVGFAWSVYNFIVLPTPSHQGLQPSLQGWGLMVLILSVLVGFALFANLIVLWIFQMLYARWFAGLTLNDKMQRRAKNLIWSGPLMVIVGSMCLMIGPLIFVILYYNMHKNLKRDVKAILDDRQLSSGKTTEPTAPVY